MINTPFFFDKAPSDAAIETIQPKCNAKLFPDIESISESFDGILLDAYGVFWGGNDIGLLPGCKATMERLTAKGKIIGILTCATFKNSSIFTRNSR